MEEQKIKDTIKMYKKYVRNGDFDGFFKRVRLSEASEIAEYIITQIGLPVLEQMKSIPPYFFSNFNTLSGVVIPKNIKDVQPKAFYQSPLKSIFFEDGCTELGMECFLESSAQKIVLPNTVTSVPSKCFCDCKSLQIVNLPSSVTRIGENAFFGCPEELKIVTPLRSRHDNSTHIKAMKKDVEFIKKHLVKE